MLQLNTTDYPPPAVEAYCLPGLEAKKTVNRKRAWLSPRKGFSYFGDRSALDNGGKEPLFLGQH